MSSVGKPDEVLCNGKEPPIDRPIDITLITALQKVFQILTPSGRIRLCGLTLLTFLSALVETAGVASWIPFVAFAAKPGGMAQGDWVQWFYRFGGFTDRNRAMLVLGLCVLLLFLAGNICRATTVWLCYRFSWGENHRLSHQLLRRYLCRPYVWFLQRNSADLAKNVLEEVSNTVENVIHKFCMLMVRGFLVLFISIGLLLINPMVALSTAASLAVAYALFYRLFRSRLTRMGQLRLETNRLRYQSVLEALSVVKEAKAPARGPEFLEKFRKHSLLSSQARISGEIIGDLPGYLSETLAVGAMLGVMIYFLATEGETSSALPLIAFYIVAAIRLAPNLQYMYQDTVSIRFFLPSLEKIHRELSTDDPGPISTKVMERLGFKGSLKLQGISYSYPPCESPAIRNVNLEIACKSSLALTGRTGAGKSTLADIIAGMLSPGAGRVLVDGEPLSGERLARWQQNVGYVPQAIYMLDDTVRHNIAFGIPGERIDEASIVRAAQAAGIHEFIMGELAKGYDTPLGERGISLSGGQRQRIGIARALYCDPEVLVLDEATNQLDNLTAWAVMDAIHRLAGKKTLIVIAHQLNTIRACESVCLLQHGRLEAQGTFDELMRCCPSFRELVREDFEEAKRPWIKP